MIRSITPSDAEVICRIYNHYIENTTITFEEQALSIPEMEERIDEVTAVNPWLVYEKDGEVIGYAYATGWKSRCAFRFSREVSVYLHKDKQGMGVGSALLKALIGELKKRDLHTLIAGIALPNDASIALHEKFGFKKSGTFSEVGWKMGKWVDVGYWELLL